MRSRSAWPISSVRSEVISFPCFIIPTRVRDSFARNLYYAALRRTQGTLREARPNWEAWIIFFLRCLKKQKDNLSAKLQRERILAKALPPLSVTILTLLREHERLTISELERLTEANKNTLKVRLRELTQAGRIAKHGQGRATWYALKSGEILWQKRLLIPQSFNRTQPRSLHRRIRPEQNSHRRRDAEGQRHRPRRDDRGPAREIDH